MIEQYCAASGQQVNLQKSSVFFGSNVPTTLAEELGAIMRMPRVADPGMYLGVPAMWGRSKSIGLAYVKERILGKLQGWKHALLSQVRKKVLIKAMIQAIPAYLMNLFKFPKSICKEMDSLVTNLRWGPDIRERHIHWVSKDILRLPKAQGGLGFQSFMEFNDALLAKQC